MTRVLICQWEAIYTKQAFMIARPEHAAAYLGNSRACALRALASCYTLLGIFLAFGGVFMWYVKSIWVLERSENKK